MTELERVTHEHTQGFVTSEGRFVDRVEAARLAEEADQILPSSDYARGQSKRLFTEDLW
ncbi:MAG: hypothetical protein AAGN64_08810 [Bacteroidota bacterium]